MKRIAAITGINGYVPDRVLSNKDLETMVETTDEWIFSRTGIKERRIVEPGVGASDLGAEAVRGLLAKTGVAPEEVQLLICASVTGDMAFPDTGTLICGKVGLVNAFAFEVGAACSGFLFALTTGAQFIESGRYSKVIVVGADVMSAIVDYTDRTTCVLFGDGAGAVLLEPSKDDCGVIYSALHVDGSGAPVLHMKAGGSLRPASHETVANKEHFIYQEGKSVFKFAVKGMEGAVREVMERNNLALEDLDWVVPHQANMRIINSLRDALSFPEEKIMVNIQKYGNTTAATIPLCLWEWENQLKKGDDLVLVAFGGGFTWGAVYVKWAY